MIISSKKTLKALLIAIIVVFVSTKSFAENPIRIMLYGDSLMAGYGLSPSENLAAELNRNFETSGPSIIIINASISGNTSKNGLSRLDWSLEDSPSIVVLSLGANDMLRGLNPELTMQNLDSIINKFKKNGSIVILAGMLASESMGPKYQSQFDAIYPELAKKYDLIFMPFLLDGVALDKKYLQADYKHPNAQGIKIMASNLYPYIIEALAGVEF
jgi:acyl-CoA thioesterase-1